MPKDGPSGPEVRNAKQRTRRAQTAPPGWPLLHGNDMAHHRVDLPSATALLPRSGRPGALPGDLLGELDHESVWVCNVNGPVAPWAVCWAAENRAAPRHQSAGLGVDVIDHEDDLGSRARSHRLPRQPLRTATFIEREPRSRSAELRVPRVGEPVGQADHIPVKRDGRLKVRDKQDDVSDAVHGPRLCGREAASDSSTSGTVNDVHNHCPIAISHVYLRPGRVSFRRQSGRRIFTHMPMSVRLPPPPGFEGGRECETVSILAAHNGAVDVDDGDLDERMRRIQQAVRSVRRDVRRLPEEAAVQRLVDALRQHDAYLPPQTVRLLARRMSEPWWSVRHPLRAWRKVREDFAAPDRESAQAQAETDDFSRRVGTLASYPELDHLSVRSARTFDGLVHVVEIHPWSPEVATRIVNAVAPTAVKVRPRIDH